MFHLDGIQRLKELELSRHRVFLRVDLDVPEDEPLSSDVHPKVQAIVPTLKYLLEREARVLIGAHRTPPPNTDASTLSLEPFAAQLAALLNIEVYLPDDFNGPMSRRLIADLREDRVLVYENLLQSPEEAGGDENFSRKLAEGVEVYVSEGLFGATVYPSLTSLPRFCRERVMGFHLERELRAANKLSRNLAEPSVIYLSGSFKRHAELLGLVLRPKLRICAGGLLAATLLKAKNVAIGETRFEEDQLGEARAWLERAERAGVRVELPVDARVRHDDPDGVPLAKLRTERTWVDIGPETERNFIAQLKGLRSALVLEGLDHDDGTPDRRGVTRRSPLPSSAPRLGTRALLNATADAGAFSVLCDGPGLRPEALLDAEQLARIGFVSTAGQGFVDALCGRLLSATEALRSR
ncbi:MAG: hypothetical protein RJA70_2671 [Pseudomonadota bacterium]|jgi:phosphoglycerate kinase